MDFGNVNPSTLTLAASFSNPQTPERLAENREIIQAVRAVNGAELLGQHNELTFSLDRETKRTILKLVNRETGEVVNQIPPEHVLRLARDLQKK